MSRKQITPKFSYPKHAITSIEVSRRTTADGILPDDAPMSVMFARLNIGPTGKRADAQKARWFDNPTKSSLWRVWRIINGEPPFIPQVDFEEPHCGICGNQLEAVRPGKFQCNHCEEMDNNSKHPLNSANYPGATTDPPSGTYVKDGYLFCELCGTCLGDGE